MPSRRISRRPFGPPILIGNIRLPPASTSTSAKLSHADDRANSEARLTQAQGLSIKPGIRTAFCTPSRWQSISSFLRSLPSLRICQSKIAFLPCDGKGKDKRGKSFWRCRRPTPRTSGRERSVSEPRMLNRHLAGAGNLFCIDRVINQHNQFLGALSGLNSAASSRIRHRIPHLPDCAPLMQANELELAELPKSPTYLRSVETKKINLPPLPSLSLGRSSNAPVT